MIRSWIMSKARAHWWLNRRKCISSWTWPTHNELAWTIRNCCLCCMLAWIKYNVVATTWLCQYSYTCHHQPLWGLQVPAAPETLKVAVWLIHFFLAHPIVPKFWNIFFYLYACQGVLWYFEQLLISHNLRNLLACPSMVTCPCLVSI